MHTIETINYVIMCLFFACYAYQFAYIPLAWLPARKRQAPKLDCGSRPVQQPNRRDRACPRFRDVCAQCRRPERWRSRQWCCRASPVRLC